MKTQQISTPVIKQNALLSHELKWQSDLTRVDRREPQKVLSKTFNKVI